MLQQTIVIERPPEGPARGKWAASPWLIGALVALALAVTISTWVWRVLRHRKRQR